MKWYVLQVKSGADDEVTGALRRCCIEALSVKEESLIRNGGRWKPHMRRLMPGYVFVRADYTDRLYYVLKGIPGVLQILQADGRPAPLSEPEAAYILYLGRDVLQPSVVRRLPDGSGRPISGALADLEPDTYRINWHRRRAIVTLAILGKPHTIELSVLPENPVGLPPEEPAAQTPGSPAG